MLVANGQLSLLADFLQILCWIILPVLFLAFLVTALHHYVQRKRKANRPGDEPADAAIADGGPEDEQFLLRSSKLIRRYKDRLSYNHARFRALQQDYENLQLKYQAMQAQSENQPDHIKKHTMENSNEQWQAAPEKISGDLSHEKKELLARLEQLDRSYKSLETENERLLALVNTGDIPAEEKQAVMHRWAEENRQLKEQVAEQQYLRDLVEEKKAQVEFLQTQLEHRIKKQHETERGREAASAEAEALKQSLQQTREEANRLEAEVSARQEQLDLLHSRLSEKENEWMTIMQQARDREGHVLYIENQLSELKQQNELLNAAVADGLERAASLENQLKDEQEKLVANKQLLYRLYKEVSACVDEDRKDQPVLVALKPQLLSSVAEEY